VGIIGIGRAKGVKDSNNNSITINGSLKRTKSKELIMYIKVNYV